MFLEPRVPGKFPDILGADVPVLVVEMDGTQLPMVHTELEGRAGTIQGQAARTREVKLGCVFTHTTTDPKGRPIRDAASTTYTGAIETAELFGRRLYAEAFERGWDRAKRKVVLGDGAEWIWHIADQHFAGAIQIVDIWHAREHLWDPAGQLFPSDEKQRKRWAKKLTRQGFALISLRDMEVRSPKPESVAPSRASPVLHRCHRAGLQTIRSRKLPRQVIPGMAPKASTGVTFQVSDHTGGPYERLLRASQG